MVRTRKPLTLVSLHEGELTETVLATYYSSLLCRHILEMRRPMDYGSRKVLSILLVLCVFAVSGLVQVQAAEHAGHHAQHQAATHGTLLCSWMCAAGTVLDADVVLLQAERSPIALLPISYSNEFFSEQARISSSRAPPSYSL